MTNYNYELKDLQAMPYSKLEWILTNDYWFPRRPLWTNIVSERNLERRVGYRLMEQLKIDEKSSRPICTYCGALATDTHWAIAIILALQDEIQDEKDGFVALD